jgi:hypothetical protein
MKAKNKPWAEQKHPIKDGINIGIYWGCRICPDEFLVNEVPKPKDGLCLECREFIFSQKTGLS